MQDSHAAQESGDEFRPDGRAIRQSKIADSAAVIDAHRAHIMPKLGLHGVSDLARYAIRNAIIEG
jgi:hypothetical protein